MTKKEKITVEKTSTGYSAYSEDGAYTTGKNFPALKANMVEALNLHYQNEDRTFTIADLEINFELSSFFGAYDVINAKALAGRIGMHQSLLAQYIAGIKKPSRKQLDRILAGVHELGQELLNARIAL